MMMLGVSSGCVLHEENITKYEKKRSKVKEYRKINPKKVVSMSYQRHLLLLYSVGCVRLT